MNKKLYNRLLKYKQSLDESSAGYYRAILSSDVNEIAAIYEELGYKLESKTCSRCILGMLQNLNKEFYNYKNKMRKK